MEKFLKIFLLLIFLYLIYIALFTNKKSLCETMINLTNDMRNKNQYITYTDNNNVDYVLIRFNQIRNDKGEINNDLISKLYEKIILRIGIEQYEKITGENPTKYIDQLKKFNIDLQSEPLLAIKAVDAVKLVHNNILTVALRDVNDKTILIPYDSTIIDGKLEGKQLGSKTLNVNTILFIDKKSVSSLDQVIKLYLEEIDVINNIPVYILKQFGDSINEIKLL